MTLLRSLLHLLPRQWPRLLQTLRLARPAPPLLRPSLPARRRVRDRHGVALIDADDANPLRGTAEHRDLMDVRPNHDPVVGDDHELVRFTHTDDAGDRAGLVRDFQGDNT